jgi:hypothetical protein
VQVQNLRIIAADSAAALLDEKFLPLTQVAAVAVLVEPPYREANIRIAEPIFKEVNGGFDVIVHEAELCLSLRERVEADVIHLDSSFGSVSVEELSPIHVANKKTSIKARQNMLKILPKLRRVAGEARRKYDIDMLAIGKESIPVRIAELTAGAEAILYICNKVLQEKTPLLLGLPTKCQHRITYNKVYLHSLMEAEHEIRGYASDTQNSLSDVNITEMQNPTARGFRALKIEPK